MISMKTTKAAWTVGTYLAQRLREIGCEHLFTVPGDYVTPFLDLIVSGDIIKVIPTPNEQIASYAADGYARVRGVGAVAVTYGVGAFSVVNAVAGSFVERLPVVVVNGGPSTTLRPISRDRDILLHHATGNLAADRDVFQNVTAGAFVIADADKAPGIIDTALETALSRSRPVYVEVYKDLWDSACSAPTAKLRRRELFCDEGALKEAVADACERLGNAKSPVVWADVLIARFGLSDIFETFLTATQFPYTTSLLGKSLISEANPLFVGTYDGPSSLAYTRDVVEGSDCILGLGLIVTDDYLDAVKAAYGRMILAGDESVRVGFHIYRDVPLSRFLPALIEQIGRFTPRDRSLSALPSRGEQPHKPVPGDSSLTFELMFSCISERLQPSIILVPDESDSMYVSGTLTIPSAAAYFSQAAWGSIGYATPGAMGIAMATKDKAVYAFAGDGGFQQVAQTLATIATHELPVVVFLCDNGLYGIEQALVDINYFDGKSEARPYNVLDRWDYCGLATALGCRGRDVATVSELLAALDALKENVEPTLVRVRLGPKDLPWQVRALATPSPMSLSTRLFALTMA